MMRLPRRGTWSDTAVVSKYVLRFKAGKWRVYDVVFRTKRAWLVTDFPIQERYNHLHRIDNYKFIALQKKERM